MNLLLSILRSRTSAPFLLDARLCLGTAILICVMIPTLSPQTPGPDPVHEFLQPLVDDGTFAGGTTLIATKDRIVYLQSVGYRDVSARAPMQTDSLFWIASTTKPMTATAFMTLVDEGKVSLDDPVEKYLPEFHGQMVAAKGKDPNAPPAAPVPASHPIRIREILSHTSGLPFRSKAQVGVLDALPLKDAVRSFAAEPLNYQPGTDYAYSNEGLNTAARIIEVISGMPYERFMQQRLFDPLRMKDTTFWPSPEQVKRIAVSYKYGEAKQALVPLNIDQLTYPLDDRTHRFPMPAGGLFSTAADVAKFAQMILNGGVSDGHRIVSEAAIREMTREQNKHLGSASYGLGWSVSETGFGHGGAYNNSMEIDRSKGWILIFMVQQSGPYGSAAGKTIVPTLEKLAAQLVAPGTTHP